MGDIAYWKKKHLNPYAPGVPIVDGKISSLRNLDKENLFKAQDALDDPVYWAVNGITVTRPSEGVFRLTKTSASDRSIRQTLTNWFPQWGAAFSFFFGVKTDGILDRANVFMQADAADVVTDAEKISGPGQVSVAASRANITFLENEWSFFRITGTVKGWSTSVVVIFYPGGSQTVEGYADVVDFQLVLGNEVKPRPAGVGLDDWMMAYHPHNRLTGDNKGRLLTKDTTNPIWIGTAADGLLAVGAPDTYNIPVESIINFNFTEVNGGGFILTVRGNGDGDNTQIFKSDVDNRLYVRNIGEVSGDLISTASALNNGEFYRGRLETFGSSCRLYIDDELIGSSSSVGYPAAYGKVTYLSGVPDVNVVTEQYGNRKGGIISIGPSTAWGDCRVSISDPSGNPFDVLSSVAYLASVQQFAPTTGNCLFGFATTSSSANPQTPAFSNIHNVNGPVVRDSGNISLQSLDTTRVNRGELLHYLILKRSDTKGGAHFYTNQNSGAEWKRIWVDEGGIASQVSVPMMSNYDCIMYLTNMSLIDLNSRHENEFNDVLVQDANVTNGESHTHGGVDPGLHGEITFTPNAGLARQEYFPLYIDSSNNIDIWHNDGVGELVVAQRTTAGGYVNLGFVGGIFSASTPTTIEWVINEDRTVSIFVGKDRKLTSAQFDASLLAAVDDYAVFTTGTMTNLTIWPTNLGGALGATDRVIAPQVKDSFDFESDGMFIGRNIQFPSGGDCNINLRNSGGDNQTLVHVVTNAGNNHQLRSTPGWATLIAAGSIVSGADIMSVFEGSDSEIFENGVSDGSSAVTPYEDQTGGDFRNDFNSKFDAFEAWPRNNNIFNPN